MRTALHSPTLAALSRPLATVLFLILSLLPDSSAAQSSERPRLGIVGQQAPELEVDAWFNLADGQDRIRIADLRGKVVYLFFFQSWCPGCHSHGFPTLQQTFEKFGDNTDVVFIAVQTTFEGYGTNTAARAEETVADYGLPIPVAHDSDEEGGDVSLMRQYRSGGTPWTVLVDKKGVVRFDGFQIEGEQAIEIVDILLRR